MALKRKDLEDRVAQYMEQVDETANPVKPAHVIEQERIHDLLKKVQAVRDDQLRGAGRFFRADNEPLDPSKHYFWSYNNIHRITTHKGYGARILTSTEGGTSPGVLSNWLLDDGTHQWGDLIAMEEPMEMYEARKIEAQIRSLDNLDSERIVEEFASRHRMPTSRPRI